MINGRFQSVPAKEIPAFRANQITEERLKRPMYGMGTHVPGNKHPGKYRGGHKCSKAGREAKN